MKSIIFNSELLINKVPDSKLYIYQNSGMGDHILCNAIIRHYAKLYKQIYLFVNPKYYNNLNYMFRDLNNIKYICMLDAQSKSFINLNQNNNYLVIGITPEWFNKFNNGEYETFDHGFYEVSNVPFEDKWHNFYFKRDLEKEKYIFSNILKLNDDQEFLFVHDDAERNRFFRPEFINKNMKIIRPTDHKDINMFDFIYTIEKAKEVHVMNSSFSCLIDTMQLKTNKLFLHQYARTDMGENPNHKLKLDWTIIK